MAQPLRRQLILLNLGLLVPAILAMAWAARQTYAEHIEQLESESRSMAATIVVYLERGLDLKSLQTVIGAIPLPDDSVITITDSRGIVLARSRAPEQFVGKPVGRSPADPREVPAVVIQEGVDGIRRVYANAVYDAGRYLVSVGIPTEVANARVAPIFRRNMGIAAAVTIAILLIEFLMLRPYTRAFNRAMQFAARVADGDLSPPNKIPMPSSELERVQEGVVDMLSKLREAREAVAQQVLEERRMREELESLQRQVIRQERLAAIGLLASGVAHELNNPLQAILGFADLLHMRRDLPPNIRTELELIQKESTRASAIIRNLSRFSRQQSMEPSPLRLRDVIASIVELRQRKLAEDNIHLIVQDEASHKVVATFTEMQQVLLNFVINAEQAMAKSAGERCLTIRTRDRDGRVELEVEDTGPGVPPEDEAKLFQPFFTTKPVGEGTGLGLSVSYGIIESHGGRIGYRRAPGGGSIFHFDLPAMDHAPVAAAALQADDEP